jgi:uncharacterized membrane protein SirB2
MNIGNILFAAHSGLRWLVVLAAVLAIVYFVFGLLTKRSYDRPAGLLMTVFVRSMELQWALGLVLIVVQGLGNATSAQWTHLGIMTVAVIIVHAYMAFRRRPDSVKYAGGLGVIAATLIAVVIGVSALGGNRWSFTPTGMGPADDAPAAEVTESAS